MTRPARRRSTLGEVALAAGVSRATASRVLAGSGYASPAARDRVGAAAAALGYTPHPVARALVRGSGFRLVVAVTGTAPAVVDDSYVRQVVSTAAEACLPYDVGVSLQWLPRLRPAAELERMAADRSVAGVLLVNTTDQVLQAVPAALRHRVASVGVGSPTVPSFDIDNAAGAAAVLRHMYDTGRRRIAMVAGPPWLPCAARPVAAYREVMAEAALPVRLVPGDFSSASGRAGVAEVLRRWPDTDAVFAISDAAALGVLAGFRERGVDVPGDVAVAGFDDIPFAALSAPSLTTTTHPVSRIVAAAVGAVLGREQGASVVRYSSELVRRESA